ncbi:HpcH/HpaI aldolase family protein [Rhizobium leguminosarum]
MQAPKNEFKHRLLAGEILHGLWMSIASPQTAEALSLLGFDWLLFDTEHSPVELAAVQPLLQAASAGKSSHAVRPAWNDKVLLKRVLDMGAQTVLVPFVQTQAEAAAAVAATRYPPTGIRGVSGSTRASRFGLTSDYFAVADEEICVLLQLETTEALQQLEAIASVDGVDGIFIGPSDLAASMGHLGKPGHADVQEALREAAGRILACGKAPGILATNATDARRYIDWGFRFVAGSVDMGILVNGARTVLAELRS